MPSYNVGDLVQLTASFTTVASNSAADPTTVTISVKDPTGVVTQPAVTRVQTGQYQAQVAVSDGGTWLWRAVGTGAVQAAASGEFYVEPNSF